MIPMSYPDVAARPKWVAGFRARFTVDALRENSILLAVCRFRAVFIALVQASLIFAALILAWLLRFNFDLPDRTMLFSAAPLLIAVRLAAMARCGLLKGWWRYTDLDDAIAIVKAVALGSAAFVVCIRLVLGNLAFPRTIYVLEPMVSALFLEGFESFPGSSRNRTRANRM